MLMRRALLALLPCVTRASRVVETPEDLELEAPAAPQGPAPADAAVEGCDHEVVTAAEKWAKESPWLVEQPYHGYMVEYEGLLGDDCAGINGIPSKLFFQKANESGKVVQGDEGHGFHAVFKRDEHGTDRVTAEIELLDIVGTSSGFSVGLIQGVHPSPDVTLVLTEFVDNEQFWSVYQDDKARAGSWDPFLQQVVLAQLIYALVKQEEQKILHKDLKLENVLISPRGCGKVLLQSGLPGNAEAARREFANLGCHVVIIDLGLGCTYSKEVVIARKRPIGCVKQCGGTPEYMSPEMLNSGGYATPKSDVFAMGVLLYLLFEGNPPQSAVRHKATIKLDKNSFDKRLMQITQHLRFEKTLGEYMKKVPAIMRAPLLKMLSFSPLDRPTAAELFDGAWLDFNPAHLRGTKLDASLSPDKNLYRRMAEAAERKALQGRRASKDQTSFLPILDSPMEKYWDEHFEGEEGQAHLQELDKWLDPQRLQAQMADKPGSTGKTEPSLCFSCIQVCLSEMMPRGRGGRR